MRGSSETIQKWSKLQEELKRQGKIILDLDPIYYLINYLIRYSPTLQEIAEISWNR